jgi:Myb-like DNA-binding domain
MMSSRSSPSTSSSTSSSNNNIKLKKPSRDDQQNDAFVAATAPSPFYPPMPPLENEPYFLAIHGENNNNNINRSAWHAALPTAYENFPFSPIQQHQHHHVNNNNHDDMMMITASEHMQQHELLYPWDSLQPPLLQRQEHYMPSWALLPPPPAAHLNMHRWDSSSGREQYSSMTRPPPLLSPPKTTMMMTTNAGTNDKLWNTAAVAFATNLLDSPFVADPPPFAYYYSAAQTNSAAPVMLTSSLQSSSSSQESIDSNDTSSSSSTKTNSTDAAGAVGSKTKQRPWTAKEDAHLMAAVKIEGHAWTKIASKYFHNSRNDKQVKSHWIKVCLCRLVHSSKTAGLWSKTFDSSCASLSLTLSFSTLYFATSTTEPQSDFEARCLDARRKRHDSSLQGAGHGLCRDCRAFAWTHRHDSQQALPEPH